MKQKPSEKATKPKIWLMKTEPEVFSIDDLKIKGKTLWDGVRNYQARNFMMKDMKLNDLVLFYHSNAGDMTGVAGLGLIITEALPDPSQFDKKGEYYDPKSTPEKPRWHCVEVGFKQKFSSVITLRELRDCQDLADLTLLQKGSRLSITPVTDSQWMRLQKHFSQINEKK